MRKIFALFSTPVLRTFSRSLLTLLLAMFVAVSCSKDAEIIIPDPEPVPPIVFAVDVDLSTAPAGEFNTRAVLSEADEYAIAGAGTTTGTNDADFRVLAFGSDGKLLYTRPVKEFKGTDGVYTFTVSLDITESDSPVDLWFIANAASKWDQFAESKVGSTKETVALQLKFNEDDSVTQVIADQPIAQNLQKEFPLWGVRNSIGVARLNGNSSKGQLTSGSTPITSVNLYRMVARIDVALLPAAKTAGHELSSVILYNRNTVGSLVPLVSNAYQEPPLNAQGKPTFLIETLPISPTPAANDSLPSVTYPIPDKESITRSIYAFEVPAQGSGTAGQDEDQYFYEPCLILGADYRGGADGSNVVTWYRVSFTDGTTKLPIIRNKLYNVSIQALNGPGWSTPEDALKSVNVGDIEASVVIWTDVVVPFPD